MQATTYLIIGGGISWATAVLRLIASWIPCECDDKIMIVLSPIKLFVDCCVMIWGGVVVFGKENRLEKIQNLADRCENFECPTFTSKP